MQNDGVLLWKTPAISRIPCLSVVIPTHQTGDSLFCCLRSLAAQSLSQDLFEAILVLDGVPEVDHVWRDVRGGSIQVYSIDTPSGRNIARNIGIRKATGAVVVSLDADMIAHPNLLSIYHQVQTSEPGVYIGARRFLEPYEGMTTAPEFNDILSRCGSKKDFRDEFYGMTNDLSNAAEPFWAFSTCNLSFPRDLAIEVGLFDEAVRGWGLADNEFGYRLWQTERARFVYLPEALAVHIEHCRDRYAEWNSRIRNQKYFIAKHGQVFSNPTLGIQMPKLRVGATPTS